MIFEFATTLLWFMAQGAAFGAGLALVWWVAG